MFHQRFTWLVLLLASLSTTVLGDPLAYLSEPCDPYYPHVNFPKLTTPQWYGEEEVDAVVLLSIDDMRDPAKYEQYLRPILDRLNKIYGKAPVSIFTNEVDANDPRLQAFLKEGLSLEVHTIDHPCPLLKDGDFAKAKSTYDRCVDLMANVPNMNPVCFRMPCCDSLNTPSPRFWTEIFNKTTTNGKYLTCDSSVFNVFTADDPDLPKKITTNEKGKSRFHHYIPFDSFVNTIENYPYPYVVGDTCWELPNVVPSDWAAQHVQQPNNPDTVRDMIHALDATVIKKGTMSLVFHPHGWIRAEQIAQLIDHAQKTHGKRVKFITFAEAAKRLNEHLLNGHPIRDANGATGVRLVDVNTDGFMDVVIPTDDGTLTTRVWSDTERKWHESTAEIPHHQLAFGQYQHKTVMLSIDDSRPANLRVYQFENGSWGKTPAKSVAEFDQIRLLDLDGDGTSELLTTTGGVTTYRDFHSHTHHKLPDGIASHTQSGGDAGLRLRDINGDQKLDIVFANGREYAVHLFQSKAKGWGPAILAGQSGDANALPPIVRGDGTNNGAWFHSEHLWVQNEQTDRMPNLVDRFSFKRMLGEQVEAKPDTTEAAADNRVFPPAKSPNDALASFAKRQGIRIELVASEPQIVDPVAFDWAPDGSLWVAEMRDYPNGLTWYKKGDPTDVPGGRIKRLTDQDGDGFFETATLFLDDIPTPTAVKVWRNGVLITAAPHVIYAEDTDGDGKADRREILFEGFREGNQQHRINGLKWGIDQWLYLANGESGGRIKAAGSDTTFDIGGRDLRIQPDAKQIHVLSGQTQNSRARDDYGNWFGSSNSNPIWHFVLDDHYLKRNPHYAPPDGTLEISETPGAAPVFPTSTTLARFNDFDRANRYTSACSPEVFREQCADHIDSQRFVYVCEPVHNLISREVFRDEGLTFRSHRPASERDKELITSSDNWFRPVMARTGPDGGLWIADMYRLVIEHPEWIPLEWQKKLNLRDGEQQGRIYKVVLDDVEKTFAAANWRELNAMNAVQLASALDSSNGAVRDMAHQLLYWNKGKWKNDQAAIDALKGLLTKSKYATTRGHALYLLQSYDALTDEELVAAISNPDGGARQAIAIAESRPSPKLLDAIVRFTATQRSPGEWVRNLQQAAYSLGEFKNVDDAKVGTALANIALSHPNDPHMLASVMSSVHSDNIDSTVAKVIDQFESDAGQRVMAELLGVAVAMERWTAIDTVLVSLRRDKDTLRRFQTVRNLNNAFRRKKVNPKEVLGEEGYRSLFAISCVARYRAKQERAPVAERLLALQLLGGDPELAEQELKTLTELIHPQTPNGIQSVAIEQLANYQDDSVAPSLVERWPGLTPNLRKSALRVLMSRESWLPNVAKAATEGIITPGEFDATQRKRLLGSKTVAVADSARKAFAFSENTNREAVVKRYSAVEDMTGDLNRGKQRFTKSCATCHKLDDIGTPLGPDLTALTDKSTPAMLVAVLDPNRAVEDKYKSYVVETDEGRQFSGLLAVEGASSITLAMADGKYQQILRTNIESLRSTGMSHMPEGLEQDVSQQDLADIIAFVRSIDVPRREFPGNEPQVAPIRDDGSIRLFAMHARIYGTKLELEPKYRNLGFWNQPADRAVWSLDVPKAGEYTVVFDYACATDFVGNRLQLVANGEKMIAEIPSTGSWDNYEYKTFGKLKLPKGKVEVTLQSVGPINQFLGDFRTIILEP